MFLICASAYWFAASFAVEPVSIRIDGAILSVLLVAVTVLFHLARPRWPKVARGYAVRWYLMPEGLNQGGIVASAGQVEPVPTTSSEQVETQAPSEADTSAEST